MFAASRKNPLKLMKEKSDRKYTLYNWTPDKEEAAYTYGSEYPKYEYIPFEFRFLNDDESFNITDKSLNKENYLGEVFFFTDIWDLHLVNNIRVTNLINPTSYKGKGMREIFNFLNIIEKTDNLLNGDEPVKVYSFYPFSIMIEQIINPINYTSYLAEIRTQKLITWGYIAWQVGKLYAELYQKYSDEVGVYGHSMSDLQLVGLKVFKENIITITVNS